MNGAGFGVNGAGFDANGASFGMNFVGFKGGGGTDVRGTRNHGQGSLIDNFRR